MSDLLEPSDDFRSILGIRRLHYAIHRPNWHQFAECRGTGPEVFFVAPSGSTASAIAMCERCQVSEQCHDAAMNGPDGKPEPDGVWSATSPRERRSIAAERRRDVA